MAPAGEEGLIRAGQRGDRAALTKLLSRYRILVTRMARRHLAMGLELDDLIQEGMIGLFCAIEAFRPERGIPFERLAVVLVRRRMLSAIRGATRLKHRPLTTHLPLDESGIADRSNPCQAIEDRIGFERVLGTLSRGLSKFERTVLKHLLMGDSPKDLADRLGCSHKAIENAIARIREKARAQGAFPLMFG